MTYVLILSRALLFAAVFVMSSTRPALPEDSKFLPAGEMDAAKLLPPPNLSDQADELAELHHIQAARTPDQLKKAQADSANETVTMFATVPGLTFDLAKLPATTKLFEDIAHEESVATGPAKKFFHRARPYTIDSSLQSCAKDASKPAYNSYPSGHATVAYAMGVVLASLIPVHAQEILARSADFAESRLVCGVHFRSDIVAGEAFGTVLAIDLMQMPTFKTEYDAAEKELRAAHIGGL
jgi:acid phosphatase (class A)